MTTTNPVTTEGQANHGQAEASLASSLSDNQQSPGAEDIGDTPAEVREDALAGQEKVAQAVETRAQTLANDLLQQKHKLQKCLFYVALVFICSFYIVFILTVVRLVCSSDHELFHKEFPATATVLIGMLGSIPTILMAFLLTGLFREKEHKDKDKEKDDKAMIDASTLAKVLVEAVKTVRH